MSKRELETEKAREEKRSKTRRARQDARREKILAMQTLRVAMRQARLERARKQVKEEQGDDLDEPRTPQEIIAKLKGYRDTLALMRMRLVNNADKHKLPSGWASNSGLLLSEIANLLNRLESELAS
jgi:hypothetical protein